MNYLRRISTLRLLAIGVALTLFAAATAAIALAATGRRPDAAAEAARRSGPRRAGRAAASKA